MKHYTAVPDPFALRNYGSPKTASHKIKPPDIAKQNILLIAAWPRRNIFEPIPISQTNSVRNVNHSSPKHQELRLWVTTQIIDYACSVAASSILDGYYFMATTSTMGIKLFNQPFVEDVVECPAFHRVDCADK